MNTELINKAGVLKQSARELVQELSQLSSRDGDLDKSRTIALDLLFELSELEKEILIACTNEKSAYPAENEVTQKEVAKVGKRLDMWAKKSKVQINSRILNCYLDLALSEKNPQIKVKELEDAYKSASPKEDQSKFNVNFGQMKNIAERNHGKVFHVIDGYVQIWPPVAALVDQYKIKRRKGGGNADK